MLCTRVQSQARWSVRFNAIQMLGGSSGNAVLSQVINFRRSNQHVFNMRSADFLNPMHADILAIFFDNTFQFELKSEETYSR